MDGGSAKETNINFSNETRTEYTWHHNEYKKQIRQDNK